jgi:hypothetical protein
VRNRGVLLAALAIALLAGLSPLAAADTVIHRGIDSFTTTANGKTFYNFAKNPIPAGFFCKSSAAFTDRVTLKGLPLETGAPGQLHGGDTVVERLDDAIFDDSGTAVTRVRFRALSLVSIKPIKTACGDFHVYLSLAGKQRATTMRIYRTSENGGNFVAPLAVDARMTFIPVRPAKDGNERKLELTARVTFPAVPIPWSLTAGASTKRLGSVLVDTDGNLTPDTVLSGSSNFWPGWLPNASRTKVIQGKSCTLCEPASCHTNSGEEHCTGNVYACYPSNCP